MAYYRRGVRGALLAFLVSASALADPIGTNTALLAEFARQRANLTRHDRDGWLDLARWCETNGLVDEADAVYRDWLEIEPNDREFISGLNDLAATRSLPADSASFRRAERALPSRFRRYETARFVVLSDADPAFVTKQAGRLERAYSEYRRFTSEHGLRFLPPREKMVCVLFDRRSDYRRFAQEQEGLPDPSIAGYYSPGNDRVVFYNPRTNPSVDRAEAELYELEATIARTSHAATTAAANGDASGERLLRASLDRYERRLATQRERVDEFVERASVATTVHEAVHLLMFHTGLQERGVDYPLWICEGLATAFETDEPEECFGPAHSYGPREKVFRELVERDDLMPLRSLVTLDHLAHHDSRTTERVYHQSHSLVEWLARERPADLKRFLQLMRDEAENSPSRWRQLELFERAFGDVDVVERDWLLAVSTPVMRRFVGRDAGAGDREGALASATFQDVE